MNPIHLSHWALEGSQARQERIGCRILVCVSGLDPPIPEHRGARSPEASLCLLGLGGSERLRGGGGGRRDDGAFKLSVGPSLGLWNQHCREMALALAQTRLFVLPDLILQAEG